MGYHFLLQGIFLTQGLNPLLLPDSLPLSHLISAFTIFWLLNLWLSEAHLCLLELPRLQVTGRLGPHKHAQCQVYPETMTDSLKSTKSLLLCLQIRQPLKFKLQSSLWDQVELHLKSYDCMASSPPPPTPAPHPTWFFYKTLAPESLIKHSTLETAWSTKQAWLGIQYVQTVFQFRQISVQDRKQIWGKWCSDQDQGLKCSSREL